MKKVLMLAIFSLFTATNVHSAEKEVLFGSDLTHGGFGGPSAKLTNISDDFNIMMGGYGAWLLNSHLYLGGGGYGSIIELEGDNKNLSYGGVLIGSYLQPNKIIHFYGDLLLGAGSLSYLSGSSQYGESDDEIYVIEPTIGIAANLTEFAKLNLGISYRHVLGSSKDDLSNEDLSGGSLAMSLMFGKF